MTVMIPEAVGAAEAGGASAGAGAGKTLVPTSVRSPARSGSRSPARSGQRAPARSGQRAPARGGGGPPPRNSGGGGGRGGGGGPRYYYAPSQRQSKGRGGGGPSVSMPSYEGHASYHGVVIAEFVVTIILIGMSPFLTPRTSTSGSPSDEAKAAAAATSLAGPLVRLTAASIVFFALALLSTGEKTGKIAAAAGGLIVLGVLLNATDMFTAISQAFGAGKTTATASAAGTGSAAAAASAAAPPGGIELA